MQIFLDSANMNEIKHLAKLGIISGVTTNPSLVAKENNVDFQSTIIEICNLVDGPISAEVTTLDTENMVKQGQEISTWAPNVVIKIPISINGLEATKILAAEGIRVNMTLCFTVNQALLAASVGATFVSPFVGRLDDISENGMQLVEDIVSIYDTYGIDTQVIAASIRHPQHVVEAAKIGAHIATIPYKIILQMIDHPLTTIGIDRFMKDWQSMKK